MQFQFYSSRGEAQDDLIELVRNPIHDAMKESGETDSSALQFFG